MNQATLANWSAITQIDSFFRYVLGNPTIKSIDIESHSNMGHVKGEVNLNSSLSQILPSDILSM